MYNSVLVQHSPNRSSKQGYAMMIDLNLDVTRKMSLTTVKLNTHEGPMYLMPLTFFWMCHSKKQACFVNWPTIHQMTFELFLSWKALSPNGPVMHCGSVVRVSTSDTVDTLLNHATIHLLPALPLVFVTPQSINFDKLPLKGLTNASRVSFSADGGFGNKKQNEVSSVKC